MASMQELRENGCVGFGRLVNRNSVSAMVRQKQEETGSNSQERKDITVANIDDLASWSNLTDNLSFGQVSFCNTPCFRIY